MRKRGLTYVLAAMMLIGSTGIGGTSYVRADEPAITEEGEIETTETEEPIEEVTEEVTEEATEEVTEEIAEEPTASSTVITVEEADGEDSPTVPSWVNEYNYGLDNEKHELWLGRYKGNSTDIHLPANVVIGNKTYNIVFGQNWTSSRLQVSIWSDEIDFNFISSVKSITFEKGFVMPKTCTALFDSCINLESICLDGVDTSHVEEMNFMFGDCDSLKSIDLRSFDTSSLVEVYCMFYGCNNLESVNLSSFDMSNLEDQRSCECMFQACTSLKTIYTPLNLKYDVELPYKMYDSKGNVYTTLPKNMDHSIKLTKSKPKKGWIKDKKRNIWYFYVDGKRYKGSTILAKNPFEGTDVFWATSDGTFDGTFTGLAPKNTNGHLRFARNGVMDLTFTGLALDPQNHWRFVRNGIMDSTFTGIAQNTNGKWYYCKKGRIDTSFTNMIAKNTNGKYHYCLNGRPTAKFNGIAYCPEVNNWYYCTNGKVDFKTSGIVAPCTNGSWYYVTKSRIDRSFTGIATGTDGKKYYVIKGLVDRTFSGTVTYQGKKYTVVNGVVK